MVILRSCSSSSKSVVVLASSTLHRRFTAPLSKSIADTSEVLPVSGWPTTATLRMFSVAYTVMDIPPLIGLVPGLLLYQSLDVTAVTSSPVSSR